MAQRKRGLLEDDMESDSSGSEDNDFADEGDPDAREERALFDDPYQRKRKRAGGRDHATYGVFADDSDEEPRRNTKLSAKRRKAPTFVSTSAMQVGDEMEGGEEEESSDSQDGEASDAQQPSRTISPPADMSMPDFAPGPSKGGIGSRGGIGSKTAKMAIPHFTSAPSNAGIGARGGIGPKGGIGSRAPVETTEQAEAAAGFTHAPDPVVLPSMSESVPSVFGASSKAKRAFVRDTQPPKPAAQLSAKDRAAFNKMEGSFGARMLGKMGWQAGTGLGTTGEGIVTPIEALLRPKQTGLGFNDGGEKTEQSKAEARRLGKPVPSDDVPRGKSGSRRGQQPAEKSDVWKKPKKSKTRIEHKTYEQIVAEAGQDAPATGVGIIIDATGATPREISSLADASASWTPSTDATRIPEVRHNLRLISEACKTDLDGLAREAKALDERKRWIVNEDLRLRKKVQEEADLIARLQEITIVAEEINQQSKELASIYEASLEPFTPHFDKLLGRFGKEFDRYRLDEIVVAAIAPIFRRLVSQWEPLVDPAAFVPILRSWRHALKLNSRDEAPQAQVDVYGSKTYISPQVEKPMTPFESLVWNVWLPKVRSCINNDWKPEEPERAVALYEAWSAFLPPFIRDNVLDQLILPKVQKAVTNWNRNGSASLQRIVFPWLPHVGLRMEELVGDARRKIKSLLRSWAVGEPMPTDLLAWKDVFDSSEWESMLLKYIVPKLGATLRDDFRINPRKQDMEPLQNTLAWSTIIRPSVISQILESEFFPKWLDTLHVWLIQPRVSFEEVAQWYSFWKGTFPESVQSLPGVSRGFTRGLQLMNKAIELGPDAPTRLARPEHHKSSLSTQSTPAPTALPKGRTSSRTQEITFRSLVEEFAASHNLLFIPTGKAHETARMPLFRVSQTADGKGGLLVYIFDDAVWAPPIESAKGGAEYWAISLEDMVLRANS